MITTQTFKNSQASIQTIEFKKTFMFQDSQILNLDVSYPQINLFRNPYAQNVINSYYQQVGSNYVKYASTTLQINAISSYRYAHKNNFPFNAYDAVMKYTVTMNQDCLLSI
ncbi:MAG: DUF4163 domain-containing protein, partial [Vallitaleaceae bacterium]|nr:DUF4163 domain-containing protein [Vallitaleaceae bacterium]